MKTPGIDFNPGVSNFRVFPVAYVDLSALDQNPASGAMSRANF